jgi:hypothetical protein
MCNRSRSKEKNSYDFKGRQQFRVQRLAPFSERKKFFSCARTVKIFKTLSVNSVFSVSKNEFLDISYLLLFNVYIIPNDYSF